MLKELLSRQLKVLKRSTLKIYFFGHLNENSVRIKNSFKEHFTIVIGTYSLETRAEPAVLRTYVENQARLEPILIYRASKYKQTKEQGSQDCLWTHIFTFL